MKAICRVPSTLAAVTLLAACGSEVPPTDPEVALSAPALAMFFGDWSEPVLLDAAVNSPHRELSPALSPDKLSLYFNSDRPVEGLGLVNIWVSRRACLDCPWEPAQVLPPPVNGPGIHGIAVLSRDGTLLFWSSNREGSEPAADGSEISLDIWMVSRRNPRDDFGWEHPTRIASAPGCEGDGRVNTAGGEGPASHIVAAHGGHAHLYFGRDDNRSYRVAIDRHGRALGCAELLAELGDDARQTSVRGDGRELIFWAGPARGGLGGADLWVSTRHRPGDPWSPPVNLGAPVNSRFADLTASLSHDGTTLAWASAAARGGLGLQDIWLSTRRRGP